MTIKPTDVPYEQYAQFCISERQAEFLRHYCSGLSQRQALKAAGYETLTNGPRLLRAIKARAEQAGYSPEHGWSAQIPPSFAPRGVSTLYDNKGRVKQQWIKADARTDQRVEALRTVADELKQELRPLPPTKCREATAADLLNLYVLTDYHLGMLAWREEGGDDWDLKIAEQLAQRWIAELANLAPASNTAVLAQLGDFLHIDSLEALTPTSGHLLDVDSRFAKMIRVAIRVLRYIITHLLETHEEVHVINVEGNHDLSTSVVMREWLTEIYREETRLTVDTSPLPYASYEFGTTLLGFHHGHLRKPEQLPQIFAAQFANAWGSTQNRYIHVGHTHTHRVLESPGVKVEAHPTLAARDSYAARHGWLPKRAASAITYHIEWGELSRVWFVPEMVK